jgi:rhodanese-related sulfurtransferase
MEKQILVQEICPTTMQEWIKKGAILVDVRENEELAELAYEVPNLLHIPLSEFEERFHEIPKDKDVVLVCRSGSRSLRATAFLMHHDYENVVNMQHGMIRWAQKGFPVKGNREAFLLANSNNSGCCGTDSSSNSCC